MKNKKKIKFLLIGPLAPPIGGARVLFRQILNELQKWENFEITVIRTWHPEKNKLSKIIFVFKTLPIIIFGIRRSELIAIFSSSKGTLLFSPIIHLVSRFFKKSWILRQFGGGLDLVYKKLPKWRKEIFKRTILAADLCLFETKQLVCFFKNISAVSNVKWHPNCRLITKNNVLPKRIRCRRFIFLGKVKSTKGIKEIIIASKYIKEAIRIDIYGPLQEGITIQSFKNKSKVQYCGQLPVNKVINTLMTYDALLLPTYYEGEGYPGVILEAYSVGIPVISTNWRAIPEIVDETSGFLIEPRDSKSLALSMKKLIDNDYLYRQLCKGALRKQKNYSIEYWTNKFMEYLMELIDQNYYKVENKHNEAKSSKAI
ncbi:MAG: glycosyltransferase family 4 protein [Cellulophaga sp.]